MTDFTLIRRITFSRFAFHGIRHVPIHNLYLLSLTTKTSFKRSRVHQSMACSLSQRLFPVWHLIPSSDLLEVIAFILKISCLSLPTPTTWTFKEIFLQNKNLRKNGFENIKSNPSLKNCWEARCNWIVSKSMLDLPTALSLWTEFGKCQSKA